MLIGLIVLLTSGIAGCRHLAVTTLARAAYDQPAPSRPGPGAGSRAWWLALWLGGAAGAAWLAWGGVRGAEPGRGRISLEREEVALLRTAREALALLIKRVSRRMAGRPPTLPPGGV